MPIPNLNSDGELPPGEHSATLAEIAQRFGRSNARRRMLMDGLDRAVRNLAAAEVPRIWVDGSFVSSKDEPNDVDGVWDSAPEVNYALVDPVFLSSGRAGMRAKYGLDFYPNVIEAGSGKPFPEFFQTNRSNKPKGILVVRPKR